MTRVEVHEPDGLVYGYCFDCGEARWTTKVTRNVDGMGMIEVCLSMHCGCCTHSHELDLGTHEIDDNPPRGTGL